MQEARDEMKRRIATLERHVTHCEGERRELLDQAAELDKQIEEDKTLAESYQQVLQSLAVSVTYTR